MADITFKGCTKDQITILNNAQDYFSVLWTIASVVRREWNKDEMTKEQLIERIKECLPDNLDEIE